MDRFYILRLYGTNHLFAGFRPTDKVGVFKPVFVTAGVGKSVQASVIHESDLAETEADLAKHDVIRVDRVQVA